MLQVLRRTREELQPLVAALHNLFFPAGQPFEPPSKLYRVRRGSVQHISVSAQEMLDILQSWCGFILRGICPMPYMAMLLWQNSAPISATKPHIAGFYSVCSCDKGRCQLHSWLKPLCCREDDLLEQDVES